MIDINTDDLKSLAQGAKLANQEISAAANLLNQITVHNNWNCKERDQLNGYTLGNRKRIQALHEVSDDFLNKVINLAGEFEAAENQIPAMFQGLDSIVSKAVSIPVPIVRVPAKSAECASRILKDSPVDSGLFRGIADVVSCPIHVAAYDSVLLK